MTLTLMKALAPFFSMTLVPAIIAGSVVVGASAARAVTAPSPSASLPQDIAGKPEGSGDHPTFCKIPVLPSNVRSGKAFKEAVVGLRMTGVRLVAQTAPATFSLENTDAFAASARAEAAPPPPIAPPDGQPTDAFINQARTMARPPGPR